MRVNFLLNLVWYGWKKELCLSQFARPKVIPVGLKSNSFRLGFRYCDIFALRLYMPLT